jgi:hypothetical protein
LAALRAGNTGDNDRAGLCGGGVHCGRESSAAPYLDLDRALLHFFGLDGFGETAEMAREEIFGNRPEGDIVLEPITNVLARQKIEIGLNARAKRKIFEALGDDAIGDRRARLLVVQHGSNVGLVMRVIQGIQTPSGCKISRAPPGVFLTAR